MTIERRRLVLCQYKDLGDLGVDAVRNRDVDQAILTAERNCWFGAFTCERKKPGTGASTEYDCDYVIVSSHGSKDPV